MPRAVLVFVMALGLCLGAAPQRPNDVIRWSAVGPGSPVRPGGTADIRITAEIEPGWHLYGFAQPPGGPRSLEVKAAKDGPVTVLSAKLDPPPPKVQHDSTFNIDARFYDEKTTIVVPVRVAATGPAGTRRVSLEIAFQACNERMCLRPHTEIVAVDINIAGGAPRANGRR